MMRRDTRRRLSALFLGTAGLIAAASPAAAQDAAPETPASATAPDDEAFGNIVVTARRREENLQDVPDSITAFNATAIADRRLERIDDFLAVTSNVRINNDQDTATNNISIRGLGANRNQAAAVAFSVDGVVLPDSDAFTVDLTDVERVEVLKGPQGALYGRGAIAGAINITTRRPTNELQVEGRASYAHGRRVAPSSAPSAVHWWRTCSSPGSRFRTATAMGRSSTSSTDTASTATGRPA